VIFLHEIPDDQRVTFEDLSQQAQTADFLRVDKLVNHFLNLMNNIYFKPWFAYVREKDTQKRVLKVKNFTDKALKEINTPAMLLQEEDTDAAMLTVDEIATNAASKATKPLIAQIAQLEIQLKSNKGAQQPGALSTKKGKKSDDNKKAAGNLKGTGKEKRNNGKKSTKKKTTNSQKHGNGQQKK
jgi:hypothetical protein